MTKILVRFSIAIIMLCLYGCTSDEQAVSQNNLPSDMGGESIDNSVDIIQEEKDEETQEEAYIEIITNLEHYLVDQEGGTRSGELELTDKWIYMATCDFNDDGVFELIVGDDWTAAIFTFFDGKAEKIADICYPGQLFCINGILFANNAICARRDGSGGNTLYVSFGFVDGQYVLGKYNQETVMINGEVGTLDEMNRIYPMEPYNDNDRVRIAHIVCENNEWFWITESEEKISLDKNFDFNLILLE